MMRHLIPACQILTKAHLHTSLSQEISVITAIWISHTKHIKQREQTTHYEAGYQQGPSNTTKPLTATLILHQSLLNFMAIPCRLDQRILKDLHSSHFELTVQISQ